jgi:hypothetical protein
MNEVNYEALRIGLELNVPKNKTYDLNKNIEFTLRTLKNDNGMMRVMLSLMLIRVRLKPSLRGCSSFER